jgi:outer membrane receptor protein involved in Fe transport
LPQIKRQFVSKIYVLIIACLLTAFCTNAQTGKITGKVLNEKNEPLPGVSVKIDGNQGGTSTDVEGRFTITVSAGKKYELTFTAVGYNAKTIEEIEVTPGKVTELNVSLAGANKNLSTVTVTASRSNARKESTVSLIQFQKNTNTVAAVISAESIRRSPDRNTGEVLKRIPGTSIQEGKYLIVRGLSDRYNFAMLNGIPLTSTEPDRKTFSFDIFPSSLIDNIIINKAFVPELPGEWAGGLVQVNTKDVPAANFLNVTVGTGFNSQTIADDFYTYKGGKYDWLGIDDGIRAIPSSVPTKTKFGNLSDGDKAQLAKNFSNIWTSDKASTLSVLNKKFELSGGFTKVFKNGAKLGATLGLTYNENVKRTPITNSLYSVENNIPSVNFTYVNQKYSRDVLWGGLANVTLQMGNNHKISIKNLFNVNATNYVTERGGFDFSRTNDGDPIMARELALKSNIFFNTQISGDHNLPSLKTKFHWYGSFNILDQYIPDQRRIQYQQTSPSEPYLLLGVTKTSQTSGSRYFGFLNDYIYTAGGDVTKTFNLFGLSQSVKGGYLFQVKDRLFDSRPFAIYLPNDNPALRQLGPDQVYAPENFGDGFDNKFAINELNGYQYRYLANTILNAGFIQFDNQFTDKLRATWGVRVENYDQLIGSTKQSDIRHLHTEVRDWLPGVNITYKIGTTGNLRLSGSQTVVRPEFRELSDFQFYDFDLGATVSGNKNLVRTKISNADLRYELYPRAGEVFTVGVFYKYFKNPIELYFNAVAGLGSSFNYINADNASGYGAEVEYRKKLDFVQALKNFTVQANLSYIYNRVKSESADLDRPMQGQSPYVVNASLQYDVEKLGLTTTLLYNQIGDRIAFVGGFGVPPVWEATRPLLDFQIAKKVIKNKGEVKLNVSDIFNKAANFYYDLNDNKKFDKASDALVIKRKYGSTFNISFSYNIK